MESKLKLNNNPLNAFNEDKMFTKLMKPKSTIIFEKIVFY